MSALTFYRYSRRVATRVALTLSLGISVVFGSLLLGAILLQVNKNLETVIEGQRGQLSYWLQVNDTFQMERALYSISQMSLVTEVTLRDSSDQVIIHKSSSEKGLFTSSRTFDLKFSQNERARLVLRYALPSWLGMIAAAFFVICFSVLMVLFRGALFKMAATLSEPAVRFNQKVQSVTNLAELAQLKISNSEITELDELGTTIERLSDRLSTAEERKRELEKNEAIYQISRKVAHDIRSPIAALNIAAESADLPPHLSELIKPAVRRVKDVADDLLEKSRSRFSALVLPTDLHELITEKRLQFRDSKPRVQLLFTSSISEPLQLPSIDARSFQRSLSNLIDNCFEAIAESGEIRVECHVDAEKLVVQITDNGRGIPHSILERLGKQEISTRENGNGIGVLTSIEYFRGLGGSLKIGSELGKGTHVLISVPNPVAATAVP